MTVSSLQGFTRSGTRSETLPVIAQLQRTLRAWARTAAAVFHAAPAASETADELFERAAAYEATQPGYAADLRAAGHLARSRHFGAC